MPRRVGQYKRLKTALLVDWTEVVAKGGYEFRTDRAVVANNEFKLEEF